ncbi:hypothetical protein [Terrabacter sp. 2YAF2]|uniref:hypothetical protein n=1 Tax=Terrabacter sp. 2YAF2 TaxID=3233026 RepID=UPI003F9E2D89
MTGITLLSSPAQLAQLSDPAVGPEQMNGTTSTTVTTVTSIECLSTTTTTTTTDW